MKASIRVAGMGLAALAWLAAEPVRAQSPTMAVSTFHASASGQWKYTVTNTSPPGDVFDMGLFRVPFGSNDGVTGGYSDVLGDEWDVTVFPNYTRWVLPNGFPPLEPTDEGLFGLYADTPYEQTGDATADTTAYELFVPIEVEGPAIRAFFLRRVQPLSWRSRASAARRVEKVSVNASSRGGVHLV